MAASGKQIYYLGDKTILFKTDEEIHRCLTCMSASVVKPIPSMQQSSELEIDEKNPHIRNTRDWNSDQGGR